VSFGHCANPGDSDTGIVLAEVEEDSLYHVTTGEIGCRYRKGQIR